MKFTNKYGGRAVLNASGNAFGKGLELLKNKLFNNKDERGGMEAKSETSIEWDGEVSLDVSVEEMKELAAEYGDDFVRNLKFLKEDLRPIVREFCLSIDDAAKSILKTFNDCELQAYEAERELNKKKKNDANMDSIKENLDK